MTITVYSGDAGCVEVISSAGVTLFHYAQFTPDDPVKIGTNGSSQYFGLVWFDEVDLPNAGTVSSAFLHLKFPSIAGLTTIKAWAYAGDSPGFPNDPAAAYAMRTPLTVADSGNVTVASTVSLDVTAIVQEIINRAGWVRLNHMLFWIGFSGGGFANMETAGAFGSFSEPYLVADAGGGSGGGGTGGQNGINATAFFLMMLNEE